MRRAIATLLLVLYVPGCTSWRVAPSLAPDVLAGASRAKVTLTDSTEVLLVEPWMRADSIGGFRYAGPVGRRERVAWAAPLDSVTGLRVERANTAGTVVLVVVGLAAVGAVIVASSLPDDLSGVWENPSN